MKAARKDPGVTFILAEENKRKIERKSGVQTERDSRARYSRSTKRNCIKSEHGMASRTDFIICKSSNILKCVLI